MPYGAQQLCFDWSSWTPGAFEVDVLPLSWASAEVRPGRVSILGSIPFVRGDTNQDGGIDLSDAVATLSYLFGAGGTPGCVDAADTNGDFAVNLADPVYLIGFLFGGGSAPVAPFPDCGPGPLDDGQLGCANPSNCQ